MTILAAIAIFLSGFVVGAIAAIAAITYCQKDLEKEAKHDR